MGHVMPSGVVKTIVNVAPSEDANTSKILLSLRRPKPTNVSWNSLATSATKSECFMQNDCPWTANGHVIRSTAKMSQKDE
jgi:hypothetical protein